MPNYEMIPNLMLERLLQNDMLNLFVIVCYVCMRFCVVGDIRVAVVVLCGSN